MTSTDYTVPEVRFARGSSPRAVRDASPVPGWCRGRRPPGDRATARIDGPLV